MIKRFCLLPAALALMALTGCASQITQQDLKPAPVKLAKHHAQSVSVATAPPAVGNAESSKATMEELRKALSEAITESQAFSTVKVDGGDYQLTVQVVSEHHPAFGISFTSKIEMGWTLKRSDSGAVVWRDSITTEHTTGGGEAFVGAERVKMAISGAIKKNISTGLERIGALTL